jgi:hypothetical protein
MDTMERSVPPGVGPNPPQRATTAWDTYVVQANTSDQVIFSGPGAYGGFAVITAAGGACPITVHDGIASTAQQIDPGGIDGNAVGEQERPAGIKVVNGLTIKPSTTNPAASGILIFFRVEK